MSIFTQGQGVRSALCERHYRPSDDRPEFLRHICYDIAQGHIVAAKVLSKNGITDRTKIRLGKAKRSFNEAFQHPKFLEHRKETIDQYNAVVRYIEQERFDLEIRPIEE